MTTRRKRVDPPAGPWRILWGEEGYTATYALHAPGGLLVCTATPQGQSTAHVPSSYGARAIDVFKASAEAK